MIVDPPASTGGQPDGELASLLSSFTTLLPAQEAAASSLGKPFDIETLVASSPRAARLDEAQIDLGEGPAWEAFRTLQPVTMSFDLEADRATWPFFASSPVAGPVRSVLAVPLSFGTLGIGAVSLYSAATLQLEAEQVQLAASLSTVLGRSVIARALAEADSGSAQRDPALSRREVHQATGMVMSQTGSSLADALLAIRAHAFASGSSVREVAAEIIARRLDLSPGPDSDDPKVG